MVAAFMMTELWVVLVMLVASGYDDKLARVSNFTSFYFILF
jgi:hypothetical protein